MAKHKQPSEKQLKVVALLAANPTMKPVEAGRRAGYAESTLHNIKANILDKPLVQSWLENYQYTLNRYNVNPERLASKLDELLDAETPVITAFGVLRDKETGQAITRPDRKTQVEALKIIHEVFQVKASSNKNQEGLKKRLTLEEFEDKIITNEAQI